jgi:hypothetical protein
MMIRADLVLHLMAAIGLAVRDIARNSYRR